MFTVSTSTLTEEAFFIYIYHNIFLYLCIILYLWNFCCNVFYLPPGSAVVERATAMMSGLSSLTRKFSTGSGHRGTARPRSLVVGGGGLSKSTSEPMNLLTDQSPGD